MRLSQHLLAALPSLALAVPTQHHDARTDSVEWKSCRIAGSVPGDCGKLKVPLDYTDDECNKQLTLDIYRVPATNTPKKGSIFLNFGGPGANGVADLAAFAPNLVA